MFNNILLLALCTPTAFAYIVTSTSPGVKSSFKPKTLLDKQVDQAGKKATKKIQKYDLGLGKNAPVVSRKQSYGSSHSQDAVQYMIEYESVSEYPDPRKSTNPVERPSPEEKKTRHKPPQPTPIRLAKESLDISGNGVDASATFQVNPTELDVNTLWVEMLIHDQQQNQLAFVPA